ncbi:hypothetical protein ACFFLM_22420 [Deinococcus oregonensis]|uniref:Transposase n=1 Tax=Deinococcus oregonensis TaxID=1805970 RepID=A0ABV6B676_9DEIO
MNGWFPLARELTLHLVRTPSVNGTRDEARFASVRRPIRPVAGRAGEG